MLANNIVFQIICVILKNIKNIKNIPNSVAIEINIFIIYLYILNTFLCVVTTKEKKSIYNFGVVSG